NGKLLKEADVVLLDEKSAGELRENVLANSPEVKSVEEKPYTTKPSAPFVTSTLQQEANRKLGFSAKRTMTVAQQLYENGFITYMRTDSTTLSTQALSAARSLVKDTYGESYLPKEPRIYKTKVKNAQEAHEAIRPAGESFKTFADVKKALGQDAVKLYELIWKRTVASQMSDARGTYITLNITCGRGTFRASGKTIEFPGFLRAYVEGSDDPDAELADQERALPKVTEGEVLKTKSIEATEHSTQPPARYTEGSMIKELERRGIGRPSTWATVVETVLSRDYAFKRGGALIPTFTAMAVVNLLEDHFAHLLDYEFTARLEDDLDAISRGEAESLAYLKTFYFGGNGAGLKPLVTKGEESIDPREVCGVPIGKSDKHGEVEVRIGRYGPFLTNGENRAALPDGVAPDEMNLDKADELLTTAAKGPESLGNHPETGQPVYLKTGRYGPYVQLGDQEEGGDKPKMASLLKGTSPETVDLAHAVKLLSLPRTVGNFPDTGEEIVAANGRYGPYIKCGSDTRSLPEDITPIDVTVEQATELLRQPKKGRSRTQAKVLRELGKHPTTETTIVIKSGQYGPYVTDGEINASIPKNDNPDEVTLEQAINLIEARIASGKAKRKKKTSAKKTAKKTAAKKTGAKKTKAKKTKSAK
ncbi:MAG: DNA topoisomerase I, partial [Bdellovibrionales bacterium]|nr:DNA topoisomerase I [Bdellovibrionales bacterium]